MDASQNIFTVGIYHGQEGEPWNIKVSTLLFSQIVPVVQQRAKEDGQWCIDNDLVGDNEDKMHRMIAYVSNEQNIARCLRELKKEERDEDINFVCRDLANGSKWRA